MSVLASRSNHMDFRYLQRAKVYRLNEEGQWDDKGTGHVSVEYLQRPDTVGLVVIDEDDNATLLVHRISADDMYKRQEDTIISWTDPEVSTDLALSFQEAMGCSYIWDQICNVQRSIHFPSVSALDVGPRGVPGHEDLEHSRTSQNTDDVYSVTADALEFPIVEISALPQILKIVTEISPSFLDRDRVASVIVRDPKFLQKLMELFRDCEDLENMEGLHMIHKVIKGIISLNDGRIFDIIFGDDYIMDVIGALEYDPGFPSRHDHRAYLREHTIFKEAVPIRDPGILSKIHQTYRIGYIKDVILPRVLDDQTFATINAMILANNVAVVSALQDDTEFIKDLFARLRSPTVSEQARRDLVRFLQEVCTLSKSLQLVHRIQLFSSLVREGLFEIVTKILQGCDEHLHVCGTDILIVILNHDPSILRKFLFHQPDHTLLTLLITGMLTSGGAGLQAQFLEIMRVVLDCDAADQKQLERNSFLDIFYQKYMCQIMEVLSSGCPSNVPSDHGKICTSTLQAINKQGNVTAEILGNICELLCFCVQQHSYRMRNYVLKNKVIEEVLRLTQRREKYLVAAAVRFLRTCVGKKDEFYNRYIVKNDVFGPVLQAFLANGSRYNLLNSAVLELFTFIKMENIKTLYIYIVERYAEKLEKVDYVETFRQIKLKYEQVLEGAVTGHSDPLTVNSGGKNQTDMSGNAISDPRKRKDERALDKDEEEYFNEDSDEDDTASAPVTSALSQPAQAIILNGNALDYQGQRGHFGLVDYEDDDDSLVPGTTVKDISLHGHVSPDDTTQEHPTAKRKPIMKDASKDDELDTIKRRKMHVNSKGQLGRDVSREFAEKPMKRNARRSPNFSDEDTCKGYHSMLKVEENYTNKIFTETQKETEFDRENVIVSNTADQDNCDKSRDHNHDVEVVAEKQE